MKTVSVAVLKEQLSRYLHQTERGQTVIVTAHRRPVARLTPLEDNPPNWRAPSRSPESLLKLHGARLTPGPTAVETLLTDRAGR